MSVGAKFLAGAAASAAAAGAAQVVIDPGVVQLWTTIVVPGGAALIYGTLKSYRLLVSIRTLIVEIAKRQDRRLAKIETELEIKVPPGDRTDFDLDGNLK